MEEVLVLAGATVVDGTGAPGYRADVAIADGVISRVDQGLNLGGARVIDLDGLVLAPGFIDSHTHTDGSAFKYPLSESKLFQGVTSDVTGNCGIGCFPLQPRFRTQMEGYLRTHDFSMPGEIRWQDFTGYADQLAGTGLGVNHVPLVGHGSLRIAVMGAEDREPTPAEQQEMNRILAECLGQGAWGMSTGLIYPPGSYARTGELVALARVCAEHGGVYTSHIRGESTTLLEAVDEAIEIGRQSKARVVISHLKPIGRANWGKGALLLEKIRQARAEGINVTADQYPYEASSTSLTALVPARFHAGGADCLLAALADPAKGAELLAGIEQEMTVRGGPDKVMVTSLAHPRGTDVSGQTVAQMAAAWNLAPAAAVQRLLLREHGTVGAVYFSISEQDVGTIMRSNLVAVGSDGRGLQAGSEAKATHPRSYGTFPRVLGRYVREQQILTLEAAVHKMTGLTARQFGLLGRGGIAPGMVADLVAFDPQTIRDVGDFSHPHQYAQGIEYLFIHGVQVMAKGALTGNAAGSVLRRAR
ncbi:MAG: D-aminoacylase [Holophaga sp.]|nr:D-aminoacylase [Holophaga sp.]